MEDQALIAAAGAGGGGCAVARLAPGVDGLFFMQGGRLRDRRRRPVDQPHRAIPARTGWRSPFPPRHAERIATLLCEQPEVKPIGLGARDSLRLEAGLPLYGHDLDRRRRRRSPPISASRSPSAGARRADFPAATAS